MNRLSSRRDGFALAVALAAIVIIGGLIAGVFYASTQEYRIGRNTILQTRALAGAEDGLNAVLVRNGAGWQTAWNNASPGFVVTKVYHPSDSTNDTVRVMSLGSGSFLVTSEGRAGRVAGAQGHRRVGALVTLWAPTINMRGALTTRGATKIGGSSFIDGNDTATVNNWNCPPGGAAMPGIAAADPTQITTSGCNSLNCIAGNPKIQKDSAAADTSTYTVFGDLKWADLVAMANKYPPSSTMNGMKASFTSGGCNIADQYNWGDPYRTGSDTSCASYYPIIYASSDLQLTGGYGQGILLVEGNLQVSGGFEFFGPVIVRGTLKTTGTGGHFNGGVMAENVDLEQNTVLGDAVVRFSSCTVNRALLGTASPTLVKGRSWTELF
ncbi:MAG TPA: hypothetical protein VFS44_05580 [Gemmatimonadaceae bacterium]|nr:hypothetical protein [Gemmatimonadaceae bacterium]